jgi:putative membrane protein
MSRHDNPNRQRDHQANERTFLAWLRTAVALIAFGFAIARFGLFTRQLQSVIMGKSFNPHPLFNSQNLGLILVIFGILSMAVAAWRYNKVYWQIERGNFRPDRLIIWIMTIVVMALGVLSMPLLFGPDESPTPSSSSLRNPTND